MLLGATGPTVQQIVPAQRALAAPIWIDVMNLLADRYGGASLGEPEAPAGLVRKKFDGHQSWFMAGTEPAPLAESEKPSEMPRILYPVSGMVVALDAEVGEDRERIKLHAEPESPDLQYVLDGQTLGRTSANVLWKVQRGEHTLQLRSEQNAVLESVSFTVR